MKIAIQMDSLESLYPETDTSIMIAQEAQKRGCKIFVYQVDHLSFLGCQKVIASGVWVKFLDISSTPCYEILEKSTENLSQFAYLLIRQNPPYNLAYITATHILDLIGPQGPKILNSPKGLREAPEKILPLHFSKWMPPTLMTRQWDQVSFFLEQYPKAVIKPLYEFGGSGVFYLEKNHSNNQSLVEMFCNQSKEPFVVQKFVDEISDKGDKRIFMVHGEVKGAFTRIPQKGKILANMRSGGVPEPCELSDRDLEICADIGPTLKQMGLLLSGLDVIGGFLTEINVTSPTGFRVYEKIYGVNLIEDFWNQILNS